jgi:hypothetical protein
MRASGLSLLLGCLACTRPSLPVPPESEQATLMVIEEVTRRGRSHHGYVSLMDLHVDGAVGWLNFGSWRPRVAVLSVPSGWYRTRVHGHPGAHVPHFALGPAQWSCRKRLELPARASATLTARGGRSGLCRISVEDDRHPPPIAEDEARLTLSFERAGECSSWRSLYLYYDYEEQTRTIPAAVPGCAIAVSYDLRPREWVEPTLEVEVVPECMLLEGEDTLRVELRRGQETVLELDREFDACAS